MATNSGQESHLVDERAKTMLNLLQNLRSTLRRIRGTNAVPEPQGENPLSPAPEPIGQDIPGLDSAEIFPLLPQLQPPSATPTAGGAPSGPPSGLSGGKLMEAFRDLLEKFDTTLASEPNLKREVPVSLLSVHDHDAKSTNGVSYDTVEWSRNAVKSLAGFALGTIQDLDKLPASYMQSAKQYSALAEQLGLPPEKKGPSQRDLPTSHQDVPPGPSTSHAHRSPDVKPANPERPEPANTTPFPPVAPSLLSLMPSFSAPSLQQESTRILRGSEIFVDAAILKTTAELGNYSPEDPLHLVLSSMLGLSYIYRYEIKWEDGDLDKAAQVTHYEPFDNSEPIYPLLVRNWLWCQRLLAVREGDPGILVTALDKAEMIFLHHVALAEEEPQRRGMCQLLARELAQGFLEKYLYLGNTADLTTGINHLNTFWANRMNEVDTQTGLTLAFLHYHRYCRLGQLQDLDATRELETSNGVLGLDMDTASPQQHDPDAPLASHLSAMTSLQVYLTISGAKMLDLAVSRCRKAIETSLANHPLQSVFRAEYAFILLARFEMQESLDVLQMAVDEASAAVKVRYGPTLPYIPPELVLARCLAEQGERTGDFPQIERSLHMARRARKEFTGPPHAQSQAEYLVSKVSLSLAYNTGAPEDFNEAIRHARIALDLAPDDDQNRPQLSLHLGQLLMMAYTFVQNDDDSLRSEAAGFFSAAALSDVGQAFVRLEAAVEWSKAASLWGADSALEGAEAALRLLPQVAWFGHSMPIRYKKLLSYASDISSRAAVLAIESGDLLAAIEHLESGRNILWAHSSRAPGPEDDMKTPADGTGWESSRLGGILNGFTHGPFYQPEPEELEEAERRHPGLFALMRDAAKLRDSAFEGLRANPLYKHGDEGPFPSMRNVVRQHVMETMQHRVTTRLASLAQTTGTSQSQPSFSLDAMSPILQKGPAVVLNMHEFRCDAIILYYLDGPKTTLVPLPHLSTSGLKQWLINLQERQEDIFQGTLPLNQYESEILIPVLKFLWAAVVYPVLDRLTSIGISPKRIWWYPTGLLTFFPLHAAGPYMATFESIADTIVSSYVPTFRSLVRAFQAPNAPYNMVAIGQPNTPGMSALPGVNEEMETIRELCDLGEGTLDTLVDEAATRYKVKKALPSHTWTHLSCHAKQDRKYPFQSAFYLYNGQLSASDVTKLDLSRAQFAYTPACQSSAGDSGLPDESIHLAASLQFAGVRGVVATLWNVSDRVSVLATRGIYGHLFRKKQDGGNDDKAPAPDPMEAAEALHLAVKEMKRHGVPLFFRVPYLHFGV